MKADLFTAAHKAIRAMLYETGLKLQTVNFLEPQERTEFLTLLEKQLYFIELHGNHEDELIFPEIRKLAPEALQLADEQHEVCELKLQALKDLILKLRTVTTPAACLQEAATLAKAYTGFMSFYLSHLLAEENFVLPASQQLLEQEQLLTIRTSIQQGMKPDEYAYWLQYMLSSLNVNELIPLLKGVKLTAPKTIWEQIISIGSASMPAFRWNEIASALDLNTPSLNAQANH